MPAVKPNLKELAALALRVRHHILTATTIAGSGHPSSSLSATDILTTLFFGGFLRYDSNNPSHPNNDRFILSKGHASPLLYSLYATAGLISVEELHTLRQFGSRLEGHPTPALPWVEVATGSLGQGLSIGVGMALNGKYLDRLPYNTYVLLGDSELAEGSNWEAIQLAAHYKLDNLIGILDVNKLGQRGVTMEGHNLTAYARKFQAFGWRTVVTDGHHLKDIVAAFNKAISKKYTPAKPVIIIAKTVKGKGVKIMEHQEGWHGKALSQAELEPALADLGTANLDRSGQFALPDLNYPTSTHRATNISAPSTITFSDKPVATRQAYGQALVELAPQYPELVALDAEVSNSTFAATFKEKYPDRFFEMYIAEQNMVGAALGLSKRGKIPFVSSFAAFLTRAFDQIRVAQYSNANITFVGSHAGVSIGEDGATQMGLEDIALFRALVNSVVVYPADEIATHRLTALLAAHHGLSYLRTTRSATKPLYTTETIFKLGGSHVLKSSNYDHFTIVAAGITVYEALTAYDLLKQQGITTRVIDLYSIKPIDHQTLYQAATETQGIFTVEDHFAEGGIGEAVRSALFASTTPIYSLAVRKMPRSGTKEELLRYQEIDATSIVKAITGIAQK
jgi:transketolase